MSEPNDEPEPTPEELRDAEALAEALEGKASTRGAVPKAALETASLIRESKHTLLEDPRAEAVLERVLERQRARRPGPSVMRWIGPVTAFAAVAAVALVLLTRSPPSNLGLPRPRQALLAAQARAAGGSTTQLDAEMRGYRREVLAALEARYGGRQ